MSFHFGLFALSSALLLVQQSDINPQQGAVNIGVTSTRFPAGCSVTVDMKLSYSVVDINKMRQENRMSFTPNDTVHKQFSTDTHSWTISYDDDGIKYGKLPSEVSFRFSPPIKKLANVVSMIEADGKVQLSYQGKVKEMPFQTNRLYEKDIKYCLYIECKSIKDKDIVFSARLVKLSELETLLKSRSADKDRGSFVIKVNNTNSDFQENVTAEILKATGLDKDDYDDTIVIVDSNE